MGQEGGGPVLKDPGQKGDEMPAARRGGATADDLPDS